MLEPGSSFINISSFSWTSYNTTSVDTFYQEYHPSFEPELHNFIILINPGMATHTFTVLLQKWISCFMTSVLFCSVDNLEYHGHTIWLLNWRCFLTGFLEKISRYYPLWTLLISWNLFVMSHYFASYVSKTTISLLYEWVKLCWISVFICNLFSFSPFIMHSVYVFTDFVHGSLNILKLSEWIHVQLDHVQAEFSYHVVHQLWVQHHI